jgi:hypothetical protein
VRRIDRSCAQHRRLIGRHAARACRGSAGVTP